MDRNRIIGISAVMVALLLNLLISISITGLVISDTDPTTYIVVVMLMLFVFTAFYMKDRTLVPRTSVRNAAFGIGLFALYVIALSYSRVWLSTLFMTYRVDVLLLPLFLLSVIVATFGFEGARKMKLLIIYSVFASPLLLLPVLNLNPQFALFNANIVAGVSKAIGLPLVQDGILLTSPSNTTITISSTCADIGAFAALLMFLVPLTYLYDGKAWKKVVWVIAGMLLLLAFNLARMMSIVLIWLYYGITNAVSVFHLFAGEVLFVIAIVAMMLLASKFGMRMPRAQSRTVQRRHKARRAVNSSYLPLVIAAVLGAISLVLSLPYLGAINARPGQSAPALPNYALLDRYVISTLEYAHMNVTQIGSTNSSMIFVLGNLLNGSKQIFAMVNYTQGMYSPGRYAAPNMSRYVSALLPSGIAIRGVTVAAGSNTFIINYFTIPYNSSGYNAGLSYLFVQQVNATYDECAVVSPSPSPIDAFDSAIYNALHFSYGGAITCEAYAVASSIT